MIVVKKFYAVWCAPCKALTPIFNEVNTLFSRPDVKFEEIDIDSDISEAQHYKVQSVPTIVIVKDGFPIDRIVGMVSRDILINKINKHIPI